MNTIGHTSAGINRIRRIRFKFRTGEQHCRICFRDKERKCLFPFGGKDAYQLVGRCRTAENHRVLRANVCRRRACRPSYSHQYSAGYFKGVVVAIKSSFGLVCAYCHDLSAGKRSICRWYRLHRSTCCTHTSFRR